MRAVKNRSEDLPLYLLAAVAAGVGVLWLAGAASALLSGHGIPHGHAVGAVLAFANAGDPSRAWHAPVGPSVVYWPVTVLTLTLAGGAVIGARALFGSGRSPVAGMASSRDVRRAAGVRQVLCRARILRPSLESPTPNAVGYYLGRSQGVACWVSVEDSVVVLGPPRAGKGLHTVIPAILDAPGAVITTSTRPDNLTATLRARDAVGPVAVFDPQGLAGTQPRARWSPTRGCEQPHVAMARARALCTEPGRGVENASFWSQQCLVAVRCLLHAAALDARSPAELFGWSLSPLAAQNAVDVLLTHPDAAPGWGSGLVAMLGADARQRDSTWSMVANVFAPLADPRILAAVSPEPDQQFDPGAFLRSRGTVYLLGTASGASATASLVTAFVDDLAESARQLAALSPGARLDPPVALILDEAANYPLPSLPALMSEGGGSGITTVVVLQSLAQARARWGTDAAAAIWDAAIVKLILGGSGNAGDLRDLSTLIGTRQEERVSRSRGPDGRGSTSISTHETPILDTGALRTMPFGKAVLLLRAAPPILLDLQPWTKRRDADALRADRAAVEGELCSAAAQ